MPPTLCRPPAISLLQITKTKTVIYSNLHKILIILIVNLDPFQPTGEGFVGAASNSNEILDDVLTVGGLATTTLAQQDNGLILASCQEVSVCSLGHAVNVRGGIFPPAAFKHLHHLKRGQVDSEEEEEERRGQNNGVVGYTYQFLSFSVYFVLITLIFCCPERDVSLYAQAVAYLLRVH